MDSAMGWRGYKDRRLKTLDPRLKMSRMTDKDKSKTLEP